VIMHHASNL